jgi:hypothetical protein
MRIQDFLPFEEEEGRSTRTSVWSAIAVEDWLGDFFFL